VVVYYPVPGALVGVVVLPLAGTALAAAGFEATFEVVAFLGATAGAGFLGGITTALHS